MEAPHDSSKKLLRMNFSEPQNIINKLPYTVPFLFVDELISVSKDGVEGVYTFPKDSFFYEGHFKDNPITPGVILTECMAQIGVVCLGIFLLEEDQNTKNPKVALSSTEIDFFIPVFPEESVTVISEKVYFRFNKLKCKVKMFNSDKVLVAKGIISGMVVN